MSFTLFNDQDIFVKNLSISLHRHSRIIGCAATGFGKSKVFITISDRYKKARPENNVLILSESLKIYGQISGEMQGRIIDINADEKNIFVPSNSISVAMAQTLVRRPELIERFQSFGDNLLTIIDECHVGTPNTLLRKLDEAKRIGFTATPDARWARHLPELYNAIVVGPQPHELVQLGRLTPYQHFARVAADLSALSIKGGEFTEESQEHAFGTAQVFDGLAEDLRTINFKKALIFCASIADCEFEFNRLSAAGFNCVRVHSKLNDAEEAYYLGQFMHGDVNICVSVGTLTKGFDCPPIDLIILRRATTSLPLYLQMCGRGSRKYAGKDLWRVLDYGSNWVRFGLWDMDRDWDDVWDKPNKPREGVAPVKLCPRCEFIMKQSVMICPNCGFEFMPRKKEEEEQPDTHLIEVTEKYSKMIGKKLSELSAEELGIFSNFKNKKSFGARIAKAQDIKTPGFLEQYAEAMGYKKNWCKWVREQIERDTVTGQVKPIEYTDYILK